MAACQEVRRWITANILVPVTKVLTETKRVCEEVRQWIEEQIAQPIERWISRQEERCKKLPWWNPLRWFCWLVTVLVKVLEWVIVTVGKWVVTIVCHVVTRVIAIIVTYVLRVVAWLVTFVVCLFSDPRGALAALLDLLGIFLDTLADIYDLGDVILGDLIGLLDDTDHLLESLVSSFGPFGVLPGWFQGIVGFVRSLLKVLRSLLGGLSDLVQGVLRMNPCQALRGVGDLAAGALQGLLATGFAPVALLFGSPGVAAGLLALRLLGYLIAGERDTLHRLRLEAIIRDTLTRAFAYDPARVERALDAISINASPMGLRFTSDARRLYLSSDARTPNLRQLHETGVIDLYAYAGYPSACGRGFNEPDGEVVYAGTDLPVAFSDLQTYLAEGAGSVPEFHVFAISRARLRRHLETARIKAEELGIQLFFPTIGTIQATSPEHVPLNAGEADPPGDGVQQELFRRMGRSGRADDLSIIPTISHFHYVPVAGGELLGLTSWFRPSANDARRSGVTYRNLAPDWVFGWVLAHELGHYWGLNHPTRSGARRGLDQIMFAPSSGDLVSGAAFYEYLFGGGVPRFTLDDARAAWEWITTDGADSLLP